MQKKYFKCYFCETGNSYLVPKEEKGKNCRCCLAYNYFFKKSHKTHRNNNNAYYKKNHFKKNNTFHDTKNNSHKSNNRYNTIQNNLSITQNQTNLPLLSIQTQNSNLSLQNFLNYQFPMNFCNNQNSQGYNYFNINIPSKKLGQEIKYKWLKKEKLTKKYMDKNKEGYECTICLEHIKINEDINLLKCGNIFHYICIEELIDHNDNKCPNCRADLKTGESQKKKDNDINNINNGNVAYHIFGTPEFINENNSELDFNYEPNNYKYEEEDFDRYIYDINIWIDSFGINDGSFK